MPSNEFVTIKIAGGEYTGWKSVAYRATATSPERSFQLVGAKSDFMSASVTSWINQDCTILSNGDLVMTGYVEDVEIEMDGSPNHEIRVTGKSRGADCVKCSVDHKTHEMRDVTVLDVAQAIDTPGIGYSTDEQLPKIDVVRMNIGDTHLKVLDKLTRKQGLFLSSTKDGGVIITRHGKQRHSGGIIEGDNFLKGVARFSSGNRFEKVKVKGHKAHGTGKGAIRHEALKEDSGARKGTVKVIVPKTQMEKGEAKEHAEHLARTRFGDSTQLQAGLQGWRDQGGQIWEIGWLVYCKVPSCELDMDLAVNELNLTQNEHETIAQLMLVHPDALGAKTGQKSAKWKPGGGAAWRNQLGNK